MLVRRTSVSCCSVSRRIKLQTETAYLSIECKKADHIPPSVCRGPLCSTRRLRSSCCPDCDSSCSRWTHCRRETYRRRCIYASVETVTARTDILYHSVSPTCCPCTVSRPLPRCRLYLYTDNGRQSHAETIAIADCLTDIVSADSRPRFMRSLNATMNSQRYASSVSSQLVHNASNISTE